MNLRKATIKDQERIIEIVETVLADYGLKTNTEETDNDITDLNTFYFDRRGYFAVLVHENRIIGSYGIFQINEYTCELRKMYLLNEFQGQGLGKFMMEDAFEKAKDLEYHKMILESNQTLKKALSLYKKYGFEEMSNQHLSDRCDIAMSKML